MRHNFGAAARDGRCALSAIGVAWRYDFRFTGKKLLNRYSGAAAATCARATASKLG